MDPQIPSLSRRQLIKGAGLAAGAGLAGISTLDAAHSEAPARDLGRVRALALIGDRYHNQDYIRVSLSRVFKELNIPIDYTIQYDQISSALLKQYQLFLILRDGMIWPDGYLGPDAYASYEAGLDSLKSSPQGKSVPWITAEQASAIKDFVSQGAGFYALHNCSNISNSDAAKGYREVMGGAYIGHPTLRPFQVRASANRHPITEGITPFVVTDEQHFVTYDKDPKYIILEAENIDGLEFRDLGTKSISGWAYDFGSGRVVFTAVGHTIHAMWNPQYLEIQKRSVRWLLRDL